MSCLLLLYTSETFNWLRRNTIRCPFIYLFSSHSITYSSILYNVHIIISKLITAASYWSVDNYATHGFRPYWSFIKMECIIWVYQPMRVDFTLRGFILLSVGVPGKGLFLRNNKGLRSHNSRHSPKWFFFPFIMNLPHHKSPYCVLPSMYGCSIFSP